MEKLIFYAKALRKYLVTRKKNEDVKIFYKKNKNKNYQYIHNIWNKNIYWDYYLQHFSHSVKSELYVPADYYGFKMERLLNNSSRAIYVNDKNMYDKLFCNKDVRLPKTVFHCINSIFFDENFDKIDDIDNYLSNVNHDLIVKKALDSRGGRDVIKFIIKQIWR